MATGDEEPGPGGGVVEGRDEAEAVVGSEGVKDG